MSDVFVAKGLKDLRIRHNGDSVMVLCKKRKTGGIEVICAQRVRGEDYLSELELEQLSKAALEKAWNLQD